METEKQYRLTSGSVLAKLEDKPDRETICSTLDDVVEQAKKQYGLSDVEAGCLRTYKAFTKDGTRYRCLEETQAAHIQLTETE